ncbi:MAG: hypothetical protein AAF585_02125 [Verrucomicrobiota bacterium]
MNRFNITLITLTFMTVASLVAVFVIKHGDDDSFERELTGLDQLRLSDTVCYYVAPGQASEWNPSIPVMRPAFDDSTPLRPRAEPAAAEGAEDAPLNLVKTQLLPASSFTTGDRQSVAAIGQTRRHADTLLIRREMNEARYGRSPLADELNADENSIEDDLEIVDSVFERYREEFGENPVGLNEDMVARLTGANPKQIAFLPADHPSINAEGQLIDRWGTPFHFHQISGTHLEIISAGPDQQIWTGDDTVHNSADIEQLLQQPTATNQQRISAIR